MKFIVAFVAICLLALTGCNTMPTKTSAPADQILQAKTFTRKFSAKARQLRLQSFDFHGQGPAAVFDEITIGNR